MSVKSSTWVAVAALVMLGAAAPRAVGQGVGPGGPFDTTYLLESAVSTEYPVGWLGRVGSAEGRIPVELDPSGPPWVKHFETAQGSPPIGPGPWVVIVEYLVISGDLPWTGWREEIVTDGFRWVTQSGYRPSFRANGSRAPDLTIDYAPAGVPAGAGLVFYFDALPPGTRIEVYKALERVGSDPFTDTITIREFPIPEPAGLVLITAGALELLRRRR